MANIVEQYIEIAKKRNPGEPEFIQTVEEVLTSIEPVLEAHPEYVETTSWSDCKILFTDDLASNSGKMKKAQKAGIEIREYE